LQIITINDGIDHINIYSKGRTELGRFLSNFAHTPINTEDGQFASIEGYWYWLGSGHDVLRELHGFKAKSVGKAFVKTRHIPEQEFKRKIQAACWFKLFRTPHMLNSFVNSNLPFTHYYVYGDKVVNAGHNWLVEMWESFRTTIRNNY
jgi:hypothetical protein